jgi:hypothetical protein
MQQLSTVALAAVLGKLQGRDVGNAMRVCRAWCELVQGDPGLRAAAEKSALADRKWRGRYSCSSDDFDYCMRSYGYESYRYSDSDCGYGSP